MVKSVFTRWSWSQSEVDFLLVTGLLEVNVKKAEGTIWSRSRSSKCQSHQVDCPTQLTCFVNSDVITNTKVRNIKSTAEQFADGDQEPRSVTTCLCSFLYGRLVTTCDNLWQLVFAVSYMGGRGSGSKPAWMGAGVSLRFFLSWVFIIYHLMGAGVSKRSF